MTSTIKLNSSGHAIATQNDIIGILGHLDAEKVLAILSLKPTIMDLETANVWMAGDADVFDAGSPLNGPAAEIVSILTTEEDE
jgi:hypothetical protein